MNLRRESGRSAALRFLACALIGGVACWWYGMVELPFVSDSRGQFFIAERVASGVPPHLSSLSAKHSLSFLLFGAAIYAGRAVMLADVWSVRLLSIILFSASLALTARIARGLSGRSSSAVFAVLSTLSFGGYVQLAAMGARPKIVLVFFMLLTTLAIGRRRFFRAGLYAGASFLCWQPASIMIIGAVLIGGLFEDGRRNVVLLLVGMVSAVLAYEAYFVWHGAAWEQLRQSYYFPFWFMGGGFRTPAEILAKLSSTWGVAFHWANPAWLFLVGGVVHFGRELFRHRRATVSWLRQRSVWAYLSVTACGAVGFTLYDQQGYPDLFFAVPFLAIFCGTGVAFIGGRIGRYSRSASLLFYAAAGMWFLVLAADGPGRFTEPYDLNDQLTLASAVARLSPLADGVYTVNCNHLLAFNHLDNWTKYSNFFRGVQEYLLAEFHGRIELPRRRGQLPDVILISRPWSLFPEFRSVLRRHYEQARVGAFRRQGIGVWIRRTKSEVLSLHPPAR